MNRSFSYYQGQEKGSFSHLLTIAIMAADIDNYNKLKKIYPAIAAAYTEEDWNNAPSGDFEEIINLDNDIEIDPDFYQYPQQGSFAWYLKMSGSFVTAMSKLIISSDENNKEELRNIYPQMIAAYECEDWTLSPDNFEPYYDAI